MLSSMSNEKTGVLAMVTTSIIGMFENLGAISHGIESFIQITVGVATLYYMYHHNKRKENG